MKMIASKIATELSIPHIHFRAYSSERAENLFITGEVHDRKVLESEVVKERFKEDRLL